MRKKIVASGLAVAFWALALAGCDEGGGLRFAPRACILAGPDQVRSATDNPALSSHGDADVELGGSVCTYKDEKGGSVWRFASITATSDTEVAKLREQLRRDDYNTAEPTEVQAKRTAHDRTLLLTKRGDTSVRGVMTTYQDITIVVYGPKGATLDRVVALRNVVWDGFTSQAAAAVAGQ